MVTENLQSISVHFFFKTSIAGKASLTLFKKILKEDYALLRKNPQ